MSDATGLVEGRCRVQVYTPMEGVPERMGLPDMSTGRRWLRVDDAADGDSPIEGVKAQNRQVQSPLTLHKSQVGWEDTVCFLPTC